MAVNHCSQRVFDDTFKNTISAQLVVDEFGVIEAFVMVPKRNELKGKTLMVKTWETKSISS